MLILHRRGAQPALFGRMLHDSARACGLEHVPPKTLGRSQLRAAIFLVACLTFEEVNNECGVWHTGLGSVSTPSSGTDCLTRILADARFLRLITFLSDVQHDSAWQAIIRAIAKAKKRPSNIVPFVSGSDPEPIIQIACRAFLAHEKEENKLEPSRPVYPETKSRLTFGAPHRTPRSAFVSPAVTWRNYERFGGGRRQPRSARTNSNIRIGSCESPR